ncbi:hypothetical protein DOTSEDRAFT_74877 [Dothistroma septosporum NZE10]|uniref:Enoyl-CoA hydratase n=1 Tax=Dothistroma septosporum (strain NZE10 / CBS 128990) TaxID=675120 RepID=N1PDN6_DOTSN|nr:hypothetical protein DOTSEDRAFT_74877 [Dothistroma septosporum NZE10]
MASIAFDTPPPPTSFLVLTYPAPRVLMMRMNREKDLNCTSASAVLEMTAVFRWFDAEPKTANLGPGNAPGVEALSNRRGKKPFIAAVNGLALGGGCENAINCDLIIASEQATFGLVEIKRGLAAYSGALPRLIRTVGLQRASEFALTGRTISAQTAYQWGFVNKVVPHDQLEREAIIWASEIGGMSPDSVICTRAMLREGWTTADVVEATNTSNARQWEELQRGDNMREGLAAFREKRNPVWKSPRL